MSDATPLTGSERLTGLDTLRGVAVLGILFMNIQLFAMPEAAYLNPTAYGDLTGGNWIVWLAGRVFFDQKFMTIFSLLFGAGIVLFAARAEQHGHAPARLHYRRMAWLFAIGLLHAYGLWVGDILVTYALCGMLVYPLWTLAPRTQLAYPLAEAQYPECRIRFDLENSNRLIYGDVATECGGCAWYQHTYPWGNWGVNSPYGSRYDGQQFRRWRSGGNVMPCWENSDNPEWNSCTTQFPPPDAYYFNYGQIWQYSGDVRVFAGGWVDYFSGCPIDWDQDGWADEGGCGVGPMAIGVYGLYMDLYELDPWSPDDYLTRVDYGNLVAPFYCDAWSCSAGSSDWVTNTSGTWLGTAEVS